jgi:hypothetical protein
VLATAAAQLGLVTAAQLTELGVPRSTVSRSDELGGMFTRVLPGVHRIEGRSPLTNLQIGMATWLYADPAGVLTGAYVLRWRSVKAAASPAFGATGVAHILVPHDRKRLSHGFAHVERTVSPPTAWIREGLPVAPIARAVMDAARRCSDRDAVRALVFEVVQRGLTTPEAIEDERRKGQKRGRRFAGLALEEVFAGVRSVPEGDVRRAFESRGVTGLLYNPMLYLPGGTFLCSPDAYDPVTGTALDVDSREHHFQVQTWEATMQRHGRMTAAGLGVLHAPPSRIVKHPDEVVDEFRRTQTARTGWAPTVLVRGVRPAA